MATAKRLPGRYFIDVDAALSLREKLVSPRTVKVHDWVRATVTCSGSIRQASFFNDTEWARRKGYIPCGTCMGVWPLVKAKKPAWQGRWREHPYRRSTDTPALDRHKVDAKARQHKAVRAHDDLPAHQHP